MTLKEKLKALAEGKLKTHEITDKEWKELSSLLDNPTTTAHQRFIKELETAGLSLDDAINMYRSSASNMETYQAKLEKKIARGELTEKLATGAQVLLGLGQVATSATQINRSNRALRRLRRPSAPGVPTADPYLDNAISEASRGTFDASRAAAIPARELRNRRLRDENIARQVSGGQAAEYAAANQLSSLNSNRGYAEMVPMIDSIRAREQARLDQLIEMRRQQTQDNFRNRMAIYDQSLNNFNADATAAAQLGQAGRENLFTGLSTLADALPTAGGYMLGTGNKEIDAFTNKANNNLIKASQPITLRQPALNQLAPILGVVPKLQLQQRQQLNYGRNISTPVQSLQPRRNY